MAVNYSPSTADVASILCARAVDGYGNRQEDFNDSTVPTGGQAQKLLDEAVDEVSGEIGETVPDDMVRSAKRLVTFLAAANIELSYFPEQAAANNSAYDKLMARYKDTLTSFETDEAAEVLECQRATSGNFPAGGNWGTRLW